MSRPKKGEQLDAGERALTQLLARLPDSPTSNAIRAYVERLRLDAIRPRPRPRTRRARLQRDLEDAEVTFLRAKAQGSTQAMVAAQRQRREIMTEIEEELRPKPGRPPDIDLANASIVERLEWQQHGLALQLAVARDKQDVAAFANVDRRLQEVGDALDGARLRASRIVRIERTPNAISVALEDRAPLIHLRAEMQRRKEARAAAAEAAEPSVARERNL